MADQLVDHWPHAAHKALNCSPWAPTQPSLLPPTALATIAAWISKLLLASTSCPCSKQQVSAVWWAEGEIGSMWVHCAAVAWGGHQGLRWFGLPGVLLLWPAGHVNPNHLVQDCPTSQPVVLQLCTVDHLSSAICPLKWYWFSSLLLIILNWRPLKIHYSFSM